MRAADDEYRRGLHFNPSAVPVHQIILEQPDRIKHKRELISIRHDGSKHIIGTQVLYQIMTAQIILMNLDLFKML